MGDRQNPQWKEEIESLEKTLWGRIMLFWWDEDPFNIGICPPDEYSSYVKDMIWEINFNPKAESSWPVRAMKDHLRRELMMASNTIISEETVDTLWDGTISRIEEFVANSPITDELKEAIEDELYIKNALYKAFQLRQFPITYHGFMMECYVCFRQGEATAIYPGGIRIQAGKKQDLDID